MSQAIQPDASAWVGANAGAGKTYILVSRLVRLMLDGVAPQKLLCLTYTRSAAAEMQERLFDLLGQWALMDDATLHAAIGDRLGADIVPDDLGAARVLFARALETPGGLRVQTIHAFCESLLKRFPLEAGLSPQFDLMDEQDMQDMHFELVTNLIRDADEKAMGGAMSLLSRALAEPDLLQLGRLIIDRRAAFEQLDRAAHLKKLAQKTGLAHGDEPVPDEADLMRQARLAIAPKARALAAWLAEGGVSDQNRAAQFAAWIVDAEAAGNGTGAERAQWAKLAPIFLTLDGHIRATLATQALRIAQPQLAQLMHELAAQVHACETKLRGRATYDLTAALLAFAAALIADYAAAKAARAMLDYDDLIATTNRLLSGERAAQWVLFKIDSGLQHILVDEAQDTSPAQWRLIGALADEFFSGEGGHESPRTLFAVGDEKQSIFSFQGADPSQFDAQRHYFEDAVNAVGGHFHYVPMTLSWRSTPQVLQLVDAVFADAAARQGVSLEPVTHFAHRADAIGHVELWPLERPQNDAAQTDLWDVPEAGGAADAAARLAARIAAKAEALIHDEMQNVTAGDMLILVRKRDGFVDEMIRALKRRGIEVAGADRMVLLEQMVIMDILAAADFALNSEDDLTLACLLRSPLCGLSEERLFALAHGRSTSLWQAVEAASGDKDLAQTHQRLLWMRNQIDYLSPFEWLSQLLAAQGGHADLRAQLGAEIDDPVAELLRLALAYEQRHVASMQGFLHWLRHGQQEIKRDMEGRGAAVRIMTVHGAKGLEAPIVFLPDTCRRAKSGGRSDALQLDEDGLPLWRASQYLREAYGQGLVEAAEKLAAEEEKRLLYVALTRARDRLYIGGYLGRRSANLPQNCWYERLAAAFGAPPETDAITLWPDSQEVPLVVAEKTEAQAAMPPLPDWLADAPDMAHATDYIGDKIFSPSGLANEPANDVAIDAINEAGALGAQADVAVAAQRGRLVHKLLESLPALPPETRQSAALAFLARQADSDAEADAAMLDEVMRLMAAPDMAPIFSPAARAEAPIAGFLTLDNGQRLALSGLIDRYVETDDAIYLVDFKTGQRPDTLPRAYGLQMAAYQALMRAAKPEKPVRCGLVWTRHASVDWLDDGQLTTALGEILSGARKPA